MRNFREYDFWKDSMNLTKRIYLLTDKFPKFNGLINQIQRASVSIPSNIAEGAAKSSTIDFARYLEIALGSAYETETQVELSYSIGYISSSERDELIASIQSIERRLTSFINTLRKTQ